MTTAQDVKKAPEIGRGSPAGPRWFVSKNPTLVLEVMPQYRADEKTGKTEKYLRIGFKSVEKPWTHLGEGKLGSANKRGSDSNASRHYGVHFVIDPGPVPTEGYKDDAEDPADDSGRERPDWRRTAEEKADDRHVIDHIRNRVYGYKNSPQDNRYRVTARLIELNWDPNELTVAAMRMAEDGPGRAAGRPVLESEPTDGEAREIAGARVADMGGGRTKVVSKTNR